MRSTETRKYYDAKYPSEKFAIGYFNWMVENLGGEDKRELLGIMHDTEFTWSCVMDKNRAEDGQYLRILYEEQSGVEMPDEWLEWPCSFLEMAVALAMAMDSILYDPGDANTPATWFWILVGNLGLSGVDDIALMYGGRDLRMEVEEVLGACIGRKYGPDGLGSLFPSRTPGFDARDLELWDQMNHWIQEQKLW